MGTYVAPLATSTRHSCPWARPSRRLTGCGNKRRSVHPPPSGWACATVAGESLAGTAEKPKTPWSGSGRPLSRAGGAAPGLGEGARTVGPPGLAGTAPERQGCPASPSTERGFGRPAGVLPVRRTSKGARRLAFSTVPGWMSPKGLIHMSPVDAVWITRNQSAHSTHRFLDGPRGPAWGRRAHGVTPGRAAARIVGPGGLPVHRQRIGLQKSAGGVRPRAPVAPGVAQPSTRREFLVGPAPRTRSWRQSHASVRQVAGFGSRPRPDRGKVLGSWQVRDPSRGACRSGLGAGSPRTSLRGTGGELGRRAPEVLHGGRRGGQCRRRSGDPWNAPKRHRCRETPGPTEANGESRGSPRKTTRHGWARLVEVVAVRRSYASRSGRGGRCEAHVTAGSTGGETSRALTRLGRRSAGNGCGGKRA